MTLSGPRLGFIGAGQMAEAFIGGLLAAGVCNAAQIRAADPSAARRDLIQARFGVAVGTDNAEVARWAEVVVLAVKPQLFESVLLELRSGLSGQLVVSIAAGIRLAWIRDRMPTDVRLIRVMPNAPALVGAGMSALARDSSATDADLALARRLCDAVGRTEVVEEAWLDAVTGLSGSGPAFVFAAMEALADGGVKAGLPRDVAERLVVATVRGAALLKLAHRNTSPGDQEPDREGLRTLEAGAFRTTVANAVVAAAERSRELGA